MYATWDTAIPLMPVAIYFQAGENTFSFRNKNEATECIKCVWQSHSSVRVIWADANDSKHYPDFMLATCHHRSASRVADCSQTAAPKSMLKISPSFRGVAWNACLPTSSSRKPNTIITRPPQLPDSQVRAFLTPIIISAQNPVAFWSAVGNCGDSSRNEMIKYSYCMRRPVKVEGGYKPLRHRVTRTIQHPSGKLDWLKGNDLSMYKRRAHTSGSDSALKVLAGIKNNAAEAGAAP